MSESDHGDAERIQRMIRLGAVARRVAARLETQREEVARASRETGARRDRQRDRETGGQGDH